MKTLFLLMVSVIFPGLAMAATTLPPECAQRIRQIAALIPGDDGRFSSPSDVIISNLKLLSQGAGGATGIPYTNYSVSVSVADFTGSASVSDSAGSCYILHIDINGP